MPIVRYCGKTVSRMGLAMVLSDRALAIFYRLSILTISPSATVLAAVFNGMFKL